MALKYVWQARKDVKGWKKKTEKLKIIAKKENKITIKNISCIIKFKKIDNWKKNNKKKRFYTKKEDEKTVLSLSNIFIPNKKKNNNRLLF